MKKIRQHPCLGAALILNTKMPFVIVQRVKRANIILLYKCLQSEEPKP